MGDDASVRGVTRRDFLTGVGGVLAAASLGAAEPPAPAVIPGAIPVRPLGRTGVPITILGLGTAPVGHSMPGKAVGVPVYRAAIEAGMNYIDTARGYDAAESYLGEIVPQCRDKIFLATKVLPQGDSPAKAAESMRQQFEQSLRLLKTDHVDLLHIHNAGALDPDLVLGSGGPLDFVRRMKDQGKTRFIGLTGHTHSARFPQLLKTGQFDVLMVVLNFVDYHLYPFERDVLPVAREMGCAVLAMKVFGGHRGGFAEYRRRGPAKMPEAHLRTALDYSLSIPGVAGAVIGAYTADEVCQCVKWAAEHKAMDASAMERMRLAGKVLSRSWGTRFGAA